MPKREPRQLLVPLDVATTPRDGETLVDRWWVAREGKLLLHFSAGLGRHDPPAPQCNSNRVISDRIAARLYPDAEVIHVPVVYLGHGGTCGMERP